MKDMPSRIALRSKPSEAEMPCQTSFEFGTVEQESARVLKFPARAAPAEQLFRENVIKSLVRLRIISR